MKIPGIDISKWQGDFDLAKAKAEGFEFVIVKGGGSDGGRYVDPRFTANYEKARALGMPVGVYWFARAATVADAVADADYLYENCLRGRQFELPIYLDVEGDMLKLSRRLLTDICLAWCKRLEERGFCPGIYAGFYTFRDHLYDSELRRIAHWLAQWTKAPNYKEACLGMWQYGGETNLLRSNKVAGQVCDQNYMLTDYPASIRAAGLNGFSKTAAETPQKETNTETKEEDYEMNMRNLRIGCKGEDVRALQILLMGRGFGCGSYGADGDFGKATDAAVRAFQKARGLAVDGIAGPATMGALLGV